MTNTPIHQDIEDYPLSQVISERYLSYALSTIMSRSLPDVRDGLKPVHRRLLYAMYQLRLNPSQNPKKCARVVGDVIGKFHPHGDQAVYDALVRLAQDFAVRYPLIDGQGNFGNIDGDNPAAMRYTEARLTDSALMLLDGIEEDAVSFRETYDGETQEPIVLPAGFPNILANGATGIAVGMATNIPPHNILELCDACIHLLDKPDNEDKVYKIVKGPDFPTGGLIVQDDKTMREAYQTGRGSVRVRAKWEREELGKGQYQIIVTELPYQVAKGKLIEKIGELIETKKLPLLDLVDDESAEDIRVVLTPKNRNVDPNLMMESLFRMCDLETRFSFNMNVLDEGVTPKVMSLPAILRAFLNHQQDVLVRRSKDRLAKVIHRLEVLDGYLIVFLNLDRVIEIIRENDQPKPLLMEEFGLTETQAEAILNMRLRSLRKLEEMELKKEHDSLAQEQKELEALISTPDLQWARIKQNIADTRADFAAEKTLSKRRTQFCTVENSLSVVDLEAAMIEKEPITLVLSHKGWVRAIKGHQVNEKEIKYKDGDKVGLIRKGYTTDKFVFLASDGRAYTVSGDKFPSGRGFGEPINLMFDMDSAASIADIVIFDAEAKYLVASSEGYGFLTKGENIIAQTKNGRQLINVNGKSRALILRAVPQDHDTIAVIGKNRKLVVYALEEVSELSKGKGVRLQKYKSGEMLSDVKTFAAPDGLAFKYGSGETVIQDVSLWSAARGAVGKLPPNGFPKNNRF